MKNLKLIIFVLISLVTISSCEPTATNRKTDIPVEVVKLKELKHFDTSLTISTNEDTYVFAYGTNDYITTTPKKDYSGMCVIFGIFIGVIITLVLGALFDN